MKWIIAILIFSLLIIFHEFGHFLVARLNGVDVVEFSLGFGPRLLSTEFHGTRYSLKLLMFGGSCQMKGMAEAYLDDEDSDVPKEPESGSFQSVSVGRRAAIIFAGPFFNFILAFICAVVIIAVIGYDPAYVTYVGENSPAAEAGLETGDLIKTYMGRHVDISRDVSLYNEMHSLKAGEAVTMTVERDGKTLDISFVPEVLQQYMLGFTYNPSDDRAEILEVSDGGAFDKAGIVYGDVITGINDTEISSGADLQKYFNEHQLDGSALDVTLEHRGRTKQVTVTPEYVSDYVKTDFDINYGRMTTSPLGTLKYSLIEIRYQIGSVVQALSSLFTGKYSVNDLSGPVAVVDTVGSVYEEVKDEGPLITWMNMLNLIVLLSANLGVMNLLPIPAIDGGRLLFLLIEAVRGKPMNRNVELNAQLIAAFLLIVLMVYVMWHDISMVIG